MVSFPNRNDFYTEVVSSSSSCMDTNYSFTIEYYCYIHLGYSIIYNKELPSGFLAHSEPSPSFEVKAIIGFIPINLHLCKISGQALLRAHSFPHNHILYSLLESRPSDNYTHYSLSLDSLTCYQRENIKGTIIDMDNWYNEVFSSFDPLNTEFSPGSHIINVFPSHFSFYPFTKSNNNNLENYTYQLNNVAITSLLDCSHALIISDSGIKNNVATSIAYIYVHNRPIVKTIHHTANITSTEAKLFAIRYSINQAVNLPGISKIVVITNSLHTAKKIFDSSIYPF